MQNNEQALINHMRLQLNVKYPDLQGIWLDGHASAQQEVAIETNPYPQGSSEYHYWSEGWWSGFYGEPALFNEADELSSYTELAVAHKPALPIVITTAKQWLKRVGKLASAVFVTMVIYEVADIIV